MYPCWSLFYSNKTEFVCHFVVFYLTCIVEIYRHDIQFTNRNRLNSNKISIVCMESLVTCAGVLKDDDYVDLLLEKLTNPAAIPGKFDQ